MSDKDRSAALNKALQEGDGPMLADVCLAPPILSGLTKDTAERYIQSLREMKCPDLLEASSDLGEAYTTSSAIQKLSDQLFDNSYNFAEQSEIDAAEASAKEAEADLQRSLEA